MFKRIKKLYSYRRIFWSMSINQLKAKYAGSKLGIWWAIITPLLLAVSINLIFTTVFKINIANYTLFVLSGLIPWLFSTNALGEVTNSFSASASLLKQAIFPREIIPISIILSNFLSFCIGLLFLLPLFISFNIRIIKLLPVFFLVIIFNFIFIVGIGLFFSSLNVFYKDLSHFLSIGFTVWFWITPVFYSLDMLSFPYRWFCILNPMTYYVILYQQILFKAVINTPVDILATFFVSLVSIICGYLFFIKKELVLLKRI